VTPLETAYEALLRKDEAYRTFLCATGKPVVYEDAFINFVRISNDAANAVREYELSKTETGKNSEAARPRALRPGMADSEQLRRSDDDTGPIAWDGPDVRRKVPRKGNQAKDVPRSAGKSV
jgi:hypothetical protein